MAIHYNNRIIKDGLVLCLDAANRRSYPGSGTAWNDLSGNGNHGILTNGPTFNSSNGGSVVFDGVNDYIISPISSAYSQGTISCWVFPKALNNSFFVYTINSPLSVYSHQLGINSSSNLHVYIWDGNPRQSSGEGIINLNKWHNAAFYWIDNNSYGFYLNGVFQGSGAIGVSWKGASNIYIGSNVGTGSYVTGWLNGNIAQSLIYNRALSNTEIIQNFNATKSRYGY